MPTFLVAIGKFFCYYWQYANVEQVNDNNKNRKYKVIDGRVRDTYALVFNYKLGNRSALECALSQYRVKVDKRSGIVNAPNREEDESYILELIKKIIN
jgi:predicted helicase